MLYGSEMIQLTRLNDSEFYVNPHQVEFIEKTPDTVITMLSGKKLVVTESIENVIDKIINYRRRMYPGVDDRSGANDALTGNEF